MDTVPFEPEEEKDYLQQETFKDSSGHEYRAWRGLQEMLSIEPKGAVKRARDEFLGALTRSTEKGELKVDRLRKSMEGIINPADTLIDIRELEEWAEVRSIKTGDLFYEYDRDESKVLESLRSVAQDWRDAADRPLPAARVKELEQVPEESRESFLALIRENERLRTALAQQPAQIERPFSRRAFDSLLKIIAAMAYDCYRDRIEKPWSVAKDVQEAASKVGLDLSDDTIASKIKEAVGLIPKASR